MNNLHEHKYYHQNLNGNDFGSSIKVDGSGNVYVIGSTFHVYDDVLILKHNSSGVLQWAQTWNNDDAFGDD